MSSLPGLKRLAEALDASRQLERELDQQDQVEDVKRTDRLTEKLQRVPAERAQTDVN